jgi:hypothetical protein
VKNSVFDGWAAANFGGGAVSHTLGARPGSCAPCTYQGTGVFAAAWAAPAAAAALQPQLTTISNHLDMTRFGAAGGSVPGSHPAWDPV